MLQTSQTGVVEGYLFDCYSIEEEIHLWIMEENPRRLHHLIDRFYPIIYAEGKPEMLQKLVRRLLELQVLYEPPQFVDRKHFYNNTPVQALQLKIKRPSFLKKIRNKLYALHGRLDIYHTDIELPTAYMYDRDVFPLAPVRAHFTTEPLYKKGPGKSTPVQRQIVTDIKSRSDIFEFDYRLPELRILRLGTALSARRGLKDNELLVRCEGHDYRLPTIDARKLLSTLNLILNHHNPDVILSTAGDQMILPTLFEMSQKVGVPIDMDRDPTHGTRRNVGRGTSYNTYGSWIYVAPSYPLFGRWHIDTQNSFVYKEANLLGIIELARISRIPVQKLARSSTGTALTAIETDVALRDGYLVPWQKSSLEEPKTAYELLTVDKGGLVFIPDSDDGFAREQVAQLDFSQMYPTIMARHNVSPECINCECCKDDPRTERVPEANYHICVRRRGVVSRALEHILDRRAYYKKRKANATSDDIYEAFEARQSSLKWMLVTSFGYLGYRNAKFGKIESHESVTAFGRKVLLTAKTMAEDAGYHVAHGITDCLFLHRKGETLNEDELLSLCTTISNAAGIEFNLDGIFDWVVFVPSRQDAQIGVTNRYFGRFRNGSIKCRGIAARRKDTCPIVRKAQLEFLDIMACADSIRDLLRQRGRMQALYEKYDERLRSGSVPWRELLLRKKASREFDQYVVANASFLSMLQLRELGIEVQPGEKVHFIARQRNHPDIRKRYIVEELAEQRGENAIEYDTTYYRLLLWEALREIWENFAPEDYFAAPPGDQLRLFV